MRDKIDDIILQAKTDIGEKHHYDIAIIPYKNYYIREELFREIAKLVLQECTDLIPEHKNTIYTHFEFNPDLDNQGGLDWDQLDAEELPR